MKKITEIENKYLIFGIFSIFIILNEFQMKTKFEFEEE
ncbi:putative hypothetical protein [Clostridium botulinum BKT015925]|nr:putative hypothetical protein [Clostridium botulinum BKT015925]